MEHSAFLNAVARAGKLASIHYYLQRVRLHVACRSIRSPLDVHWVSPTAIRHVTGRIGTRTTGHLDYDPYFMPNTADWNSATPEREIEWGSTVGGDWDARRESFSRLAAFRALERRFREGINWERTAYFQRHRDRILDGNTSYCSSVPELHRHCHRLDQLYARIDSSGYQSQRALDGYPTHEVMVNVARDGTLLYNSEGRHRLSIAKILDVPAIPMLVLAVHRDAPPADEWLTRTHRTSPARMGDVQ